MYKAYESLRKAPEIEMSFDEYERRRAAGDPLVACVEVKPPRLGESGFGKMVVVECEPIRMSARLPRLRVTGSALVEKILACADKK